MIEETEKIGYEKLRGYDPRHRNNWRLISESPNVAKIWLDRVKHFVENSVTIDREAATIHKHPAIFGEWEIDSLNPRIRYKPGNHFGKHYDEGYHPDPRKVRTVKTCMVYLNGGFEGGHTRFYDEDDEEEPFYLLKPVAGMCLVFNQNILHDGEKLGSGLKYIMRTDIHYRFARTTEEYEKMREEIEKRAEKAQRVRMEGMIAETEFIKLQGQGKTEEAEKWKNEAVEKYHLAYKLDPDCHELTQKK